MLHLFILSTELCIGNTINMVTFLSKSCTRCDPGTRCRRVRTQLCTSNFLLEEVPMCRGPRMQNSNRDSRCVLARVTTLRRERYRTISRYDFEAREIVSHVFETTGAACVTDEGYGLRFSVDEEQARNITGRGQNLNVNSFGWKNDGSSGFFLLLHFLCSLFALPKKLTGRRRNILFTWKILYILFLILFFHFIYVWYWDEFWRTWMMFNGSRVTVSISLCISFFEIGFKIQKRFYNIKKYQIFDIFIV